MPYISDESIDLIVTSPPYPMIQIWDSLFERLNPKIQSLRRACKIYPAFDLMHKELDKTWAESYRVLKKGGFVCINIGDAARTAGADFQLHSNHSRIAQTLCGMGFHALPLILWHKKTNAPNKFMGSGMLPAGAYVTLEHEHILIFRKGGKREFKTEQEKSLRKRSAFFWEERNKWFSDIWFGLPGASQNTKRLRRRSAAFPLELPYRLICMFSAQADTVLDPFAGTGTTALAAIALGRNSISIEIDKSFQNYIADRLARSAHEANSHSAQRLLQHIEFLKESASRRAMKYKNSHYGFPVMTAQEKELQMPYVESISSKDSCLIFARHAFLSSFQQYEAKSQTGGGDIQKTMAAMP